MNIFSVFNVGQVPDSLADEEISEAEREAMGIHYEFPELQAAGELEILLIGPNLELRGWVQDTSYVNVDEDGVEITILYVYCAFEMPEARESEFADLDEDELSLLFTAKLTAGSKTFIDNEVTLEEE